MARRKTLLDSTYWRGAISILVFLVLWEIGSLSKIWIKWEAFEWLRNLLVAVGFKPIYLPWIGAVPAPTEVLAVWTRVLADPGYWQSWYMSFFRVLSGFVAAMLIGIPFGLVLAVSRTAFGMGFPVFEVLRPIPPLAWVPASILFWPTQEMSIAFVTFLGAFFTIVITWWAAPAPSMSATSRRHARWDRVSPISSGGSSCRERCPPSWSARRSAWESPGKSS